MQLSVSRLFFLAGFILFFNLHFQACHSASQPPENVVNDSIQTNIDTIDTIPAYFYTIDNRISYTQSKQAIQQIRANIDLNTISEDSLSLLFTNALVQQIIPYWYGTRWSFEGHTNTPKQGEIACGYFVSTTLKHAGLNINRYKMAQQLPVHEAQTLALTDTVTYIENADVEQNIEAIKKATKNGIYFIGFDNGHVGYLLKKDEQIYLIHSNYASTEGVMIERIEQSNVFAFYRRFHLAEISRNRELMKKWVRGEELKVISK